MCCPPTNRSHPYDTRISYGQRRLSLMHYLRKTHYGQAHILFKCHQFNEIRIQQGLLETLFKILSPTPETS